MYLHGLSLNGFKCQHLIIQLFSIGLWVKDFARLSQSDPSLIETPPAKTARFQVRPNQIDTQHANCRCLSTSLGLLSSSPVPRPLLLLLHPWVVDPRRCSSCFFFHQVTCTKWDYGTHGTSKAGTVDCYTKRLARVCTSSLCLHGLVITLLWAVAILCFVSVLLYRFHLVTWL